MTRKVCRAARVNGGGGVGGDLGPARARVATGPSSGADSRGMPGHAALRAGRDDEAVEWTAPVVVRVDEPFVAGEREMLQGFLDFGRRTLLVKCAGLTGEQLIERAVPPSALSLLGLVRHVTDVEIGRAHV